LPESTAEQRQKQVQRLAQTTVVGMVTLLVD